MTTLGEILARLDDRSEIYRILMESGNAPLVAKLDNMTDEADSDPCAVALGAARDFLAKADDEAWVKLIGRVQDSLSPAGTCLGEMIAWALNHRARQKGPILGVILAGGASSRYGSDKALAPLGCVSLLQRIADQVQPQVDLLALSGKARPGFSLQVIADDVEHAGPLAALRTILAWADARKYPLVATFPCDTPFVPAGAVKRLRDALNDSDCAMAQHNGVAHPACTIWKTTVRAKIEDTLALGVHSLQGATARVSTVTVDFSDTMEGPEGDPFFNINTHADMVTAEAWLQREHQALQLPN